MRRMLVTCLGFVLGFYAGAYDTRADDLSVTVYNNDLAVIRDTRDMTFNKGLQTKTMTDVPERIDPTSVRFSVEGGGVDMIEQNYRYDLVNSQKVLRRYIDSAIAIQLKEGDLIEGVLQSVAGDVVISTAGGGVEIVRLDAIERFSFPKLPEGLITRPTLFWKLTSDRARTAPAEISYMSSGFEWHAEYTAVIAADEKSMDMTSWVSVHNNSGATYENADLKLVAGDVHRVRPPQIMRKGVMMAAEQDQAGGFEERGLFEYHLYDLQGQTTIRNAEIKQIALFPETMAKVKKVLVFDARKQPDAVIATVEFTNSDKDGLGIPLPAGKVRVYSRDEDGAIEFVGEDNIDHTPKNEEVTLTLGTAFDIAAERKVMDSRRITDRIREETIEIELRNRKTVKTDIKIVEHFWGDWEIRKSTDEFVKKDAFTAECTVSVPADETRTVALTVRYR